MKGEGMLEAIGYKKEQPVNEDTTYIRRKGRKEEIIVFYVDRHIEKFSEFGESEPISMEELEAIRKVCKEMGWIS